MAGPPPPPRRRFDPSEWRGAGLVSAVGFTLVICSGIGTLIGWWVDKKWHTEPWGIAVGFLFGTVAGFVELFEIVSRANKDDDG